MDGITSVRVFTITEPVFKSEPLFIVDCSFAQLSNYMQAKRWPDVGLDVGQVGQMFTFQRSPWRVVWAKRNDLGIVLHETFHLVTRICADRGIPIRAHDEHGECGDEAAAFLFEYFSRAVLKRLR